MSHADGNIDASEQSRQFIPIAEALKLIPQSFDGTKDKLNEFIDNCDIAFELVSESEHDVLLKFVKTRIVGAARSKLLVRDLTATWQDVKSILLENYASKRTLDYYACKMFSSRQEKNESVAQWGSRIDAMQHQFREAIRGVMQPSELEGSLALIGKLGRAVFIQGIYDDRIKTIVRARGERVTLSEAIEIALTEESAIVSLKETNAGYRANLSKLENKSIKCHNCGKLGHLARECRSLSKCAKCGRSNHSTRDCRYEKRVRAVDSMPSHKQTQREYEEMRKELRELRDGVRKMGEIDTRDFRGNCRETEGIRVANCDFCNLPGHKGFCTKAVSAICYKCRKPGHLARNCTECAWIAQRKKQKPSGN